MPSGQPRTLTFTEYLAQNAPAALRQELTKGVPVTMPPESKDNIALTIKLAEKLKAVVDGHLICTHATTLQVPPLPNIPQENRFPDLIVLTPELADQPRDNCSAITLEMLNPALVVEVVSLYDSPNEENYRSDYIEKRQQYEQRGIPEYWIVDPTAGEVTVLALMHEDGYQARAFQGQQRIRSSGFPSLVLTVDELLALGTK
jgi:Uma2 family endonuclease